MLKRDTIFTMLSTDPSSFTEWATKANAVRFRCKEEHEELSKKRKELSKRPDYNGYRVNNEMKKATDKSYAAMNVFIDSLDSDLDSLIDGKKKKVAESVTNPPKESDVQILRALEKIPNVSAFEIQTIAESFEGRYLSLRWLSDIAAKSGVTLNMPVYADPAKLNSDLEALSRFGHDAVEELRSGKEPSLKFQAFFSERDPERPNVCFDPYFNEWAEDLDSNPQLELIKAEKTSLTDAETKAIEDYFESSQKDNDIETAKELLLSNPNNAVTLKLSQYKNATEQAEQIIAEEAKAKAAADKAKTIIANDPPHSAEV